MGRKKIMIYEESESVIKFKVENGDIKVETVLKTEFSISSRLFVKLIQNRNLFINGKSAHRKDIAKQGDIITIVLADEEDTNVKQSEIPLDIIYEDLDLVIVNKQPYMVVHPTKNHPYDTVLNAMAGYFEQKNIKKKVRFVNRLDRDTSGVVVIAKNSFGHQQMSKQFIEDTVEKGYMAVVDGVVTKDSDTIDLPIERESEDSIIRIVREDGKSCITKYRVVERYENATLLEVKIETGRTHQIRVHLKHIGHPIVGDSLYNKESSIISRQALHSYYLKFKAPRNGEYKEVRAELPEDIKKLIERAKIGKI